MAKPKKPKKPTIPEAEKLPRKATPCQSMSSDDERGRVLAKLITSPEIAASRVMWMMQPKGLADERDIPTLLPTLVAALRDQAAAVQGGDLTRVEAMLINQASTLQALFVGLTERALEQTNHQIAKAAILLEISRTTLWEKMTRLGIVDRARSDS